MNRTNLLATGAIVALVFATGAAMAQQEHGGAAPAEKPASSGAKQPSAIRHQNDEGQNTPARRSDGRTSEAPQDRSRRPETSGQAPREDQPNRLNGRTSEPKRGETEQRAPATGQAPAPRDDGKGHASQQNRFEQGVKANREEGHGTVGQGAAGARANINITPDKRARIHETIIHERNAPRVSSVNFDISVGTRVPRGVRFMALPQAILEIEPAWRGFEYFLIGDEIVIVDPGTLEIVAVVDA